MDDSIACICLSHSNIQTIKVFEVWLLESPSLSQSTVGNLLPVPVSLPLMVSSPSSVVWDSLPTTREDPPILPKTLSRQSSVGCRKYSVSWWPQTFPSTEGLSWQIVFNRFVEWNIDTLLVSPWWPHVTFGIEGRWCRVMIDSFTAIPAITFLNLSYIYIYNTRSSERYAPFLLAPAEGWGSFGP